MQSHSDNTRNDGDSQGEFFQVTPRPIPDTGIDSAADGGTAKAGGPSAAGDEAVSITCLVPVTKPDTWQFLSCGVDTLHLGLGIEWGPTWSEVTKTLEALKLQAAGGQGIKGCDGRYLVLPSGKPPSYRWHLEWPDFHLFLGISPVPHKNAPNALVGFKSKALWSLGIAGVVEKLQSEIKQFGGKVLEMKPSRCDLAADFLLPAGLSLAEIMACRVPQHFQHSHHMVGDRLQTFYQGAKSSPIQLRIYDKGSEVENNGEKYWFLDVWQRPVPTGVWRVEFQLRRKILRDFAIHSLPDLTAKLGGLWSYLTLVWFSLRKRDDSNTTRRTVWDWWQAVAACADQFGPSMELTREFAGEPADSSWYVSHCAGCLAGFAACENLTEFDEAAGLLFLRIQNYWQSRDFAEVVAAKLIKLGVTPDVPSSPGGSQAA